MTSPAADTSALIDEDPVLDRAPGGGGKLGPRLYSEPGQDHVRLEPATVLGRDARDAARTLDPATEASASTLTSFSR